MAKTNAFVIQVTSSSSTGAFHNISDYITDFSGLNIEAILEESHAVGDSWREVLYTGFRQANEITMGGFYDDAAASGPHALFGQATDLGAERVMKLNFGTTNAYPKFDYIIRSYNRTPTRGQLTRFEAVLAISGAITVVTT